MKNLSRLCSLVGALAFVTPAQVQPDRPAWAYVVRPPDYKDPVDDGSLRHVPDSSKAWTLTQLRDFFFAPDWHPGDHAALPEVVAHGRKPELFACGFCHRADGPGGPENATLAGLPEVYIVQQMADFRSGSATECCIRPHPGNGHDQGCRGCERCRSPVRRSVLFQPEATEDGSRWWKPMWFPRLMSRAGYWRL